jgi:ATP-dependent RecD-like DNA helicase SH3 domain
LNIELQAELNPAGDRKVERFGWTFAPGDKVMQIENDYDKEVCNGDIGYIEDVDLNAGEIVAKSLLTGKDNFSCVTSQAAAGHPLRAAADARKQWKCRSSDSGIMGTGTAPCLLLKEMAG